MALYGVKRQESEADETATIQITKSMARDKSKLICLETVTNLCELKIKDLTTYSETYQVSKIIIQCLNIQKAQQ